LKKLGIRADAANGGLAAQQCIKQSRYDVVVTDLQMPILGGYELAAWIKHESERIPVIIMTGCSFLEIEEKLNAGRVDAWLFKPFHFSELRTALNKFLGPQNHAT
jgi:two-component system capsular synthesis sensor histidine kinase RcsC